MLSSKRVTSLRPRSVKVSLTLIFLFSEEENEIKAYLLLHFIKITEQIKNSGLREHLNEQEVIKTGHDVPINKYVKSCEFKKRLKIV